jgi:hypothetical protein
MPRTTPLIFGIAGDSIRDGTRWATYFQAQGDGTYSPAYPFGTKLKFSYLDAIFRTGPDVDGNNVEWIGLFLFIDFQNYSVLHFYSQIYSLSTRMETSGIREMRLMIPVAPLQLNAFPTET